MRTWRLAVVAVVAALAILPLSGLATAAQPDVVLGPPIRATPTVLGDGIAPGLIRGVGGFGAATVTVPTGGYVTYIARTDSRLRGKPIQIWTKTGTADWKLSTSRTLAPDGTVHVFARVTAAISFWARFAGDGKYPPAASHGRAATPSTNGTTIIRAGCDDFAPPGSGSRVILNRTIGLKVGGTVSAILCSNPSTGFLWSAAAIDAAHLKLIRHKTTPPAGGLTGAAGLETWTYRLIATGSGRATLTYSQPWKGGEKAVWTITLLVQSQR